jgi:hypothetical protein
MEGEKERRREGGVASGLGVYFLLEVAIIDHRVELS